MIVKTPMYREFRLQVFRETVDIVLAGRYVSANGKEVVLPLNSEIEGQTRFYSSELPPLAASSEGKVKVAVVQGDCLATAHSLVGEGREVCVLNMASRQNPGGGVARGDGAQEEYLFRCSDYFRSLYQYVDYGHMYRISRSSESYPLDRDFGGVFSRGVTVFRDTEETDYRLVDEPWQVNMVAVAGINHPDLELVGSEERLTQPMADATRRKMRTLLRICAYNGQKDLVLGALGCGAFRNPPRHIAELFRETIEEEEFVRSFSSITFAIKEDHNSRGEGNFKPFKEVFG